MHISNLHKAVEKGEFSFVFITEAGEKTKVDKAICTSFHSAGKTMNVKIIASGQIRTINRKSIIEFNGEEIYL